MASSRSTRGAVGSAGSAAPKQWELRAALRVLSRDGSERANPAQAVVMAAQALVYEQDGQFTMKEVAERAGVALQTLYRHFGSKDELILAVLEENIARGAAAMRELATTTEDPLDSLRRVVCGPFLLARGSSTTTLHYHARERQRLSESHPEEVELALSPYRELVEWSIGQAVAAGALPRGDTERDAQMITHLVLVVTHAVDTGAIPKWREDITEYLWSWCLAGLRRNSE